MAGDDLSIHCPVPITGHSRVLLGHGSGGVLTHELVEKIFLPAFDNPLLRQAHDGAVASLPHRKIAVTTDSYVVQPLFFPGGDIGKLAVYGSVNDLAMCGARPLYLTVGFILEEGLELAALSRIVTSMGQAAVECGVSIITGDTKVVDKGKGDGVFINTTGIGVMEHERVIAPGSIQEGDAIILSGDIGRHGIAIMASREGLAFESEILSDCAPLTAAVTALLTKGLNVHCLRDLTRGGLATALVELAQTSGFQMTVAEDKIPVNPQVRGACEVLGLDPLYIANEGRFICFVPEKESLEAVALLKAYCGNGAQIIGNVQSDKNRRVILQSPLGTSRVLQMLPGQLLPRIC